MKKKSYIIATYLANLNNTEESSIIVYEEKPLNLTIKHDADVIKKNDSVIKNTIKKDLNMNKSNENKMSYSRTKLIEKTYKSLLYYGTTDRQNVLPKKTNLGKVYQNVQPLPKVSESSLSSTTTVSSLNAYLKNLQSPLLKKVCHICYWFLLIEINVNGSSLLYLLYTSLSSVVTALWSLGKKSW